jgi:outer membrane receptor protein involved in Fe transport
MTMRNYFDLRRLALTTSVLAVAVAASSSPCLAQEAPAAATDQDCAAFAQDDPRSCVNNGQDPVEPIVVTGSRILQPEFASPNPMQSFTSDRIEQSGEINLTDFLISSPALIGSTANITTAGNGNFFGAAGMNRLNLRNIGPERTLVLVNGRRHVAGYPGTAAVDINSIPSDLVERVDILTGGVSAVYGADAVSGVVNFVLKRNFEGVRARGQIGIAQNGGAGERFGSLLVGHNFADDRGNIALAYEFSQSDRMASHERFFAQPKGYFDLLRDPADRPDDPNRPDRILFNNPLWLDSSTDGAIDLGSFNAQGIFVPGAFDFVSDFTGSGTVYDRGRPITGALTIGGSGTPVAGYFGDLLPDVEKHSANLLTSFEFSPAFRLFAEGKYVNTKAFSFADPSFDLYVTLAPDNIFLRQRFGAMAAGGALMVRDHIDIGRRANGAKRETIRSVLGADGHISDHLRYEISYVYGRSTARVITFHERVTDRYYAALDSVLDPATGRPTCRINLFPQSNIDPNNFNRRPVTFTPGQCVPLNVLGNGVASPEAIAFATADQVSRAKVTQHVVSGSVSGDLGFLFELPGGPIGFAAGAEYRKERSNSRPSDWMMRGLLLDTGRTAAISGEFDVKEAFGEISIPLLKDLPFAHVLSAGAAIRFSDYSTAGNTVSWKFDAVYAPIPDITVRGTYSRAVRAPNIFELFTPQSTETATLADPCDVENRGSGTSFRAANCAAALQAAGLSSAQIAAFRPSLDPLGSTSRPGTRGGNPDLLVETATTWTAGAVLRPRFLPGFTAAVDWYDIKLDDAINTPNPQKLVELCVDQPTLDNIFCQSISRQTGTGFINGFLIGPSNVARFDAEGLDVTLNYRVTPSPAIGTFNLRLVGGYLHKNEFIATMGADVDSKVDLPFSPKYSGTLDLTWNKGPLTANYGLNWFSRTRRYTVQQLRGQPDLSDPRFFWYKERWLHDIHLSYDVDDRFTFYAGVNDFTAQKPSVASTILRGSYPASAAGRFFYVGAKLKLEDLPRIF